jgi:hypothetical protein
MRWRISGQEIYRIYKMSKMNLVNPENLVNLLSKTTSRSTNSFVIEAARDLLRIERVAFHQQLHQSVDRIALGRHNRAGALELLVDQLSRRFLDLIEQTLAALLIRLPEMNRSEPAHAKLTDHRSRNLNRALNVI